MQMTLIERPHPARADAEHMVRRVYAQRYGARLCGFPPRMAAVLDTSGVPLVAAGLRGARCGFFSECYLDVPVEAGIAALAGEPVSRAGVLEITTLAAQRPGLALPLLAFIARHAQCTGLRWGIFTATRSLRRALIHRGARLLDLAPARSTRVSDPHIWGSYYRTDPRVCVIAASSAARICARPPAPLEAAVA